MVLCLEIVSAFTWRVIIDSKPTGLCLWRFVKGCQKFTIYRESSSCHLSCSARQKFWRTPQDWRLPQDWRFPKAEDFLKASRLLSLRRESSLSPECLVDFHEAWQVAFFQRILPEESMRKRLSWAESHQEARNLVNSSNYRQAKRSSSPAKIVKW